MRYTLLIVTAILIATTSCSVTNIPDTLKPSTPYVQLKTGEKITGTSVERSNGILDNNIIIGDTSFQSYDVATYSTEGMTFANVGGSFAQQVAAGKINLYQDASFFSSTPYNVAGESRIHIYNSGTLYIQKSEGASIKTLTYRHLAPLIEHNTPEFKLLNKYRKTRIASSVLGYGALSMFVVGCDLVINNQNPSSATGGQSLNLGASLVAVALAPFLSWLGVHLSNHERLLKTVLIADKAYRKHGHNHRID